MRGYFVEELKRIARAMSERPEAQETWSDVHIMARAAEYMDILERELADIEEFRQNGPF